MLTGRSGAGNGSASGLYELVGGPFDGGRVRETCGQIPGLIFVGPAVGPALYGWAEAGSVRHTARYSHSNGRFHFAGYW